MVFTSWGVFTSVGAGDVMTFTPPLPVVDIQAVTVPDMVSTVTKAAATSQAWGRHPSMTNHRPSMVRTLGPVSSNGATSFARRSPASLRNSGSAAISNGQCSARNEAASQAKAGQTTRLVTRAKDAAFMAVSCSGARRGSGCRSCGPRRRKPPHKRGGICVWGGQRPRRSGTVRLLQGAESPDART